MRISIDSITKKFNAFTALDSVSATFEPGRICVVAGSNGAGKTTLLRIIAGLMTPSEGKVLFGDNVPPSQPVLGVMMQELYLYRDMTPRENLSLYSSLYGEDTNRTNEVAQILNLSEFIDHDVSKLSHGQKQRVSLARAIISKPDALILDEPFLGLDNSSVGCVKRFLSDFKSDGGLALIATHEMDLVKEIADDLLLLESGRVKYFGEFNM